MNEQSPEGKIIQFPKIHPCYKRGWFLLKHAKKLGSKLFDRVSRSNDKDIGRVKKI